MPTYSLESPQTGQKYQVQFDGEPSPADLEFAAQHFDNEWWKQQGIEPGSAITQQTPLETVGNAIANVGPNLVDMVGGGMRYLDKAAQVVADVTGTQRGGLFADVAKQAEGIKAEGDVLRPLSPANPMAQAIGGGASQGIGLMATAAASVPALGARGLMAVPAVLGFGAGGGAGVQQAEQMGITSPAAQLGMGTAFGAAEAGTEALGGIGGAFFKPAKTMLGRMAGGVLSEGIEEPAAGALQDAITNVAALAVADPKRPGFTTTGFQIPGPAGYLERRGQEAIGGLAGGLVFAGMQPLMRAPGVGQPLSEAPASAPDAVPESTGDLTAADVADLEAGSQTQGAESKSPRQPILTGVPDAVPAAATPSPMPPPVVDMPSDISPPETAPAPTQAVAPQTDILPGNPANPDQPQTITGSNEQTGSEMPVPSPTAAAGAGAGGRIVAAAVIRPDGSIATGRTHREADPTAPANRQARETPNFGFIIALPDGTQQFVSREQAAVIAQANGQLIEGKTVERGQLHSDQVRMDKLPPSTPDAGAGVGEVAQAERQYTIYKIMPDGREHQPNLQPMTHKEAVTFRSKMTNPAEWGLRDITPTSTPTTPPATAARTAPAASASGVATGQTTSGAGGVAASNATSAASPTPASTGFQNLDTSGRTAGFLNTQILSEARQLIADGFTTFANWSQAMVTRFGRGIRDFLAGIWQQITSPQTNAAQNVRLGMPQGNAPVSIGAGGFVGGGQASNVPEGQDVTRSRFASPDEAENLYDIQATDTMRAESAAWLEANGIEAALAAMEANSPPEGLRIDHLPSLGAQVITRLAKLAEGGTEAQRLQADALLDRAGRAWHGKASQEAGRTLQQRAMATDELRGIAPILATKQVLVERADRVLKERFEGGAEGAVQQVKDIDTKASTQAGEELAAQLEGQPDAPELGDNPEVVPVNDSRVAELEKQMQDLREQMVREQTQAESTLAQTTSTWQKIMGVLQAAGGRKSSLLTGAKGKLAAMRKAALARKAARRAEGRLSANPVEDFADDAIIGAAILAEGLVEFTNWSQAIMREVGFRSGQDLRRLYAEASKKYLEALEAEKAAPTKAKGTPKQRQAREKINKAQRTAQNILDSLARRYSDPPLFAEGQRRVNAMRELYKERVKTGMPEAEFVKRAMALGANEGTAGILWEASNLEIDAREIMALEKSRAGLTGYLKKDSPALAKLLDALRKKVAPGMTWAEIFMTLPAEQKARQREIYRRLMLDERLKALNQGERLQLTNELDRAWQRERRKVFVRELEKITGLGKTSKDRDKVKAALPRLLRLMNLGMLNSETFRGAIAQEYGIQQIDAATGAELRKLGEQIQQAPEGLPRRKLEQQLMQRLQNLTGSTMAEVLESWWTASVLSGWRTQMDIALSLANGLEDVTLGSLVTALRTGNGRVAKDALFAMLSNLPTAMNEALDHLLTGNRAAMRSYDAEVKAALEDGNKLFGNVGRQLLNKGGMAKLPGAFMEFVSRMMTALDHINSTSTYEGAKAMALARHPELYEKALTISPQDRQAARTQARLELTGGEAPTTRQQRIEETARMKEILDQRVPLEFQAQAREIGLESALQGEPTGVGAWIYRASNALNNVHRQSLSEYEKNRPDNLAGRAVLRALRITSPLVKVLTGTKFVRTVGHSINRSLSYAPGVGLIRFAEKGMQGSAAKADILLAKQLFGTAVGLALLMAFRDGEDDEQGIEGSWRELTPQQKGQLLAEGKQPYSIWTRDAQGKIRTWNYQQWGIAGVLATIGAMEDQRRYNSQGKDDLAILMDGIVSGSMAWTDKTQLTGLQMLMGKDQAASSSPSSSLAGALNKWASTTVGGLVPRIFKDVDMVISPQLRDTSEWWMKWAGQVPMVRELSSGKRVNIFGEDIVLDRTPTSRITQVGTLDPALRTLGRLNERDIWLPDPTQGVRTVLLADGTRRKMTTLEKDRYQRATGAAYRKFITEQGAALLRMDAELARETISKVTERLRRQAAYDAVRR